MEVLTSDFRDRTKLRVPVRHQHQIADLQFVLQILDGVDAVGGVLLVGERGQLSLPEGLARVANLEVQYSRETMSYWVVL
jgi:hypothetical protein